MMGCYLEAVGGLFGQVASKKDPKTREPFGARKITVRILVEGAEHSIHQAVIIHVERRMSAIQEF